MIKILIADDDEIIRIAIEAITKQTDDITFLNGYASGEELLTGIKQEQGDVVLLDLRMPGKDGLETLKQIHDFNKKMPVLILSNYDEKDYALRCLKAGAAGYVTKNSSPKEIIKAIRKVYGGKKYLSEDMTENLLDDLQTNGTVPHEILSDRELEILILIARGLSPSQIGEKLYVSPKTISTYRQRLMTKLHFNNNADIIKYAIEHHLL
ncbi:MAG: response regulator transcription factor [Spirochaetes bacterium]|nr:response regulator transcription factor [Spirochaetota bacterium]